VNKQLDEGGDRGNNTTKIKALKKGERFLRRGGGNGDTNRKKDASFSSGGTEPATIMEPGQGGKTLA